MMVLLVPEAQEEFLEAIAYYAKAGELPRECPTSIHQAPAASPPRSHVTFNLGCIVSNASRNCLTALGDPSGWRTLTTGEGESSGRSSFAGKKTTD